MDLLDCKVDIVRNDSRLQSNGMIKVQEAYSICKSLTLGVGRELGRRAAGGGGVGGPDGLCRLGQSAIREEIVWLKRVVYRL